MPLKDTALQSQLERAQEDLKRAEAKLGDQVPKKNPDWRRANSRVKQIEARLSSRQSNHGGGADAEEATDE